MTPEAKRNLYLKLVLWMFLTMALAGAAGFVLLKYAVPEFWFGWYPAIPIYFTVLGVALFAGMKCYYKQMPGKMMHVYMIVKLIKITFTLAGLALYLLVVGENKMEFAITAFIFYEIHLITEMILLNYFQKRTKSIPV